MRCDSSIDIGGPFVLIFGVLVFVANYAGTSGRARKTGEDDWQAEYAAYLALKEAGSDLQETIDICGGQDNDEEPWEIQYANYCADKEHKLNQKVYHK